MMVKPLAPFTLQLTSPAEYSVSNVHYPTFKFKISNPSLIDMTRNSEIQSRFRFKFYMRDKAGRMVTNVDLQIFFDGLEEVVDIYGNPVRKGNAPIIAFNFFNEIGVRTWFHATVGPENALVPFVRLESDGTITIDTDNFLFREYFSEWEWEKGATYEWNIYEAGGAAYFHKSYTPMNVEPWSVARSYSQDGRHGNGASNGYFTLTIAPDAR
jgi:hypothetical protein